MGLETQSPSIIRKALGQNWMLNKHKEQTNSRIAAILLVNDISHPQILLREGAKHSDITYAS